jgi:citrate synthase
MKPSLESKARIVLSENVRVAITLTNPCLRKAASMSATTGSFSIGDSTVQMPVKTGTLGPSVVDISKLYTQTGMFTYDPGFTSTASCESEITYIDGEEGVLLYRGYPIEQIAEHGDFLETCYLLFYGQLPSAVQKKAFDYRFSRHTMVHEQMARFFQGLSSDGRAGGERRSAVGLLSRFDRYF